MKIVGFFRNYCYCCRETLRPLLCLLCLLTWVFSLITVNECTFLVQKTTGNANPNAQQQQQQQRDEQAMGLFSQAIYDTDGTMLGCVSYTDKSNFDGMFHAGRAFGTITAMWVSIAFVLIMTVVMFRPITGRVGGYQHDYSRIMWITARALLTTGTVTQVLVFLVLGSEKCTSGDGGSTCQLDSVGILAAWNAFFLVATSAVAIAEPAPKIPWLQFWRDTQFVANRDTLALDTDNDGGMAEFESSSHADSNSVGDCEAHVQWMCTVQSGGGAPSSPGGNSRGDGSIAEESANTQHSIQNSLVESTAGVQNLMSFRLTTVAIVLFSWALSIIGVQHCSFMLIGPDGTDPDAYSGLGLYTRAVYFEGSVVGCINYPAETKSLMDQSFHVARIFGAVAATLMTAVLILATLQLFVNFAREEIWFLIRLILPCATLAQVLVFVAYQSTVCKESEYIECVPGATGIVVILNIFLMTALCALSFLIPPPSNPVFTKYQASGDSTDVLRSWGHVQPLFSSNRHGTSSTKVVGLSTVREGKQHFVEESTVASQDDCPDHYEQGEESLSPQTYEDEDCEITVSVAFDEDGRRKTTKTVTHADGSKTITMTTEVVDDDDDDDDDAYDSPSEEQQAESYYRPHETSMTTCELSPPAYDEQQENALDSEQHVSSNSSDRNML